MSQSQRTRTRSQRFANRSEALCSSVDKRINDLNSDRTQWVDICRGKLLDLEKKNILRRATHWVDLVNDKIKDANCRLSIDHAKMASMMQPFVYSIDDASMKKHLGFIISWKGLKTRQIQNAPKTYLEFENKAKNWLNGRRAPNYASTLFPDMIKAAEIYSDYVSRQIFPTNATHSKMYCKIAVVGSLSSLCSARISLNDSSKKANLIPENSVKTGKTAVSQILQRYAADHPYQDKFPSHLREAADYFENKYMELISNFGTVLSQDRRQELTNNDTCSVRSSHSPPNGAMKALFTNSLLKAGGTVSLSADQWTQISLFFNEMRSNQQAQQSTIENLTVRVNALEAIKTEKRETDSPQSSESPRVNEHDQYNVTVPPPFKQHTVNVLPQRSPAQSSIHQAISSGNNNSRSPPQHVPFTVGASTTNMNAVTMSTANTMSTMNMSNMNFINMMPPNPQIPNNISGSAGSLTTDTVSTSSTSPQSHHLHPQMTQLTQQTQQQQQHQQQSQRIQQMFSPHIKGYLQQRQQQFNGVKYSNSVCPNLAVSSLPRLPSQQITDALSTNGTSTICSTRSNGVHPVPNTNTVQYAPPPQLQSSHLSQSQCPISSHPQHQMQSINGAMNGNGDLPSTSLFPPGQIDSNDSLHDLKMYGSMNYGSFNSSDAGMANMATPIPSMVPPIPLDSGFGIQGMGSMQSVM